MRKLYWDTVNNLLRGVLEATMSATEFDAFRLVGGTSLSLQYGHRVSVDIDLFTDHPYGSIDFKAIDQFLNENFPYAATNDGPVALGTSYFVGTNEHEAVKIDIYYTDTFIRPILNQDAIRLANTEDILAMKLDVISRGGRKKDFWDLHELKNYYDIPTMIELHEERYRFNHDDELIRNKLIDFSDADDDFDPQCLKGKHWELIKLDFMEWMK